MNLTLREKIGQLVLYSMEGNTLDPDTLNTLRDYKIGNIIHFGNNVQGFDDAKALNAQLNDIIAENCSGVRPLISVDHEGGRVMRFARDFTWFPSSMALGAIDDPALTHSIGCAMGKELRAAGFNLSLGPVADVLANAKNPSGGVRMYGTDEKLVARHVVQLASGMQENGVMACVKHFPGSGNTEQDSHYFLPSVDSTMERLDSVELVPFCAAFAAGCSDALMTTHVLFPNIEPDPVPATMSPRILTELLRNKLGFKGIIITDGIHMKAIADHYGVENGCIAAINAGADLICLGSGGAGYQESQKSCLEAMYQAALSGKLSMKRVDEAVARILALKEKYGAFTPAEPDFAANDKINEEACLRAATWLTDCHAPIGGSILCVGAPVQELAFGLTHADPRAIPFAQLAGEALGAPWAMLDGAPLPDYDTLVIGVQTLREDGPELAAARAAVAAGKKAALIFLAQPLNAHLLPEGCPAVCVYTRTPQSVRAACDVLTGQAKATGALPTNLI